MLNIKIPLCALEKIHYILDVNLTEFHISRILGILGRHHRVTLDRVTFISSEEVPILSVMKSFFVVVSDTICSFYINIKTRRNYKLSEVQNKICANNVLKVKSNFEELVLFLILTTI